MIKNKKNFVIILSLIIALHLIFVLISAFNKPLQGDEVSLIKTTDSIKNNGNPSTLHSFTHPIDEGNGQPLLYYYLVALSTTLLGNSLIAWRSVSIIFNVGIIIMVYFVALFVLGKNKGENEQWALLAATLYALNPLTIQSSIMLEIEVVLNFFTLLFVFLFIKDTKPIYLVLSLFLVFWSKLTGPTVLFASFFFYLICTKRKDKIIKIKESVFVFISALLLFFSSYWLYVAYYKLRFLTPFEHGSVTNNILSIISGSIMPFVLRSGWSFKLFFYFAIPFFVLLFISLFIVFLRNRYYIKYDKVFFVGAVAIFTILIFFAYGATGFNFPKYYAPALPLMAIFSAFTLKEIGVKINFRKNKLRYIILVILIALYFASLLKDPLIPEVDTTLATIFLNEALILVLRRFALYVVLPLIVAGVIFYKVKLKNKWLIILVLLTFILYLYLAVIQATADYSTHHQYGVYGLEEIVSYIQERNISSYNVATYPAVGYYIGYNKYYDLPFVYNDPNRLREFILDNPKVKYIVMLEKDFDRIGRENLKDFEQEKKIGDYYVLKRI